LKPLPTHKGVVATTYGYDAANNRTSKSVATTPTGGTTTTALHTYAYGNTTNGRNSNQIVSWTKPDLSQVSYNYDANGSRKTRSQVIRGVTKTDTYNWNPWNRLYGLALQSSSDTARNGTYGYAYDQRTRRVLRDESAAGGSRDIIVFSSGVSAMEYESETGQTPATAPEVEYVRGSDWVGGVGGILYSSRTGALSWAHYNGRGDVVARSGASGSLTYATSYEAFGTRTREAGTNPTRQQANTKDEDPTGLLNEGMRYRDLELGMFISRDPAGFVDGPNVYTYVRQNPWTFFDPLGLYSGGGAPGSGAKKRREARENTSDKEPGGTSARTIVERLNPERTAKLYHVTKGEDGTWNRKELDPSSVKGMGGDSVYNPTNGGFADTVESVSGSDDISRSSADVLKNFDLTTSKLYAHSQGGMITNKSIELLKGDGVNMNGMTVDYNGAAVNKGASNDILRSVGAEMGRFEMHAFDAVPNVIGRNARGLSALLDQFFFLQLLLLVAIGVLIHTGGVVNILIQLLQKT